MKTSTTKTRINTKSEAYIAYMNGSRCSVPADAWKDRKAVKADKVQFIVGKESGITFRV